MNEIEKFKQQYKCHKEIRIYIGAYPVQMLAKKANNGREYLYISTKGTDPIFINMYKET